MKNHKHLSQLIASAIDHDLHAPVYRTGRCSNTDIAMRLSLSSVPLGLSLWASFFAFHQS